MFALQVPGQRGYLERLDGTDAKLETKHGRLLRSFIHDVNSFLCCMTASDNEGRFLPAFLAMGARLRGV